MSGKSQEDPVKTARQAYILARFRAVAEMLLDGVRDTDTIAQQLAVSRRHVRRLLNDPRLWEQYVPLKDRWVLERMNELKAEACEQLFGCKRDTA